MRPRRTQRPTSISGISFPACRVILNMMRSYGLIEKRSQKAVSNRGDILTGPQDYLCRHTAVCSLLRGGPTTPPPNLPVRPAKPKA